MKAISPGHTYELHNLAKTRVVGQLNFIKKVDGKLMHDGTTTEDVLDVLIDRIKTLDEKFACEQNKWAIDYLEKAKAALEARIEDREKRGVEGKDKL